MSRSAAPAADLSPGRFCPECGYDLRGNSSGRCPECGLAIGGGAASPIPWCHRERIGRVKAFCRTVALTTFRPRRLAAAVAGPVDYREAERFRWTVVALASVSLVLSFVYAVVREGGTGFLSPDDFRVFPSDVLGELRLIWVAGVTRVVVLPVGAIVTLALGTSLHSFWFRPGSLPLVRQNRAFAVSRYACAPLAWLPLAIAAFALAKTVEGISEAPPRGPAYMLLVLFGSCVVVLVPLAAVWSTLLLLARTTHCGVGRVAAAAAGIVPGWALAAAVGLGVVPLVAGLVWIVIDSLR